MGGTIYTIRNAADPLAKLGAYRGHNLGWYTHTVVLKDGRVYDAFTGGVGLSIGEFKALWQYPDALHFGF